MIIAIKEKDRVVVAFSNTDSWKGLTDSDYIDQENLGIRFSKEGNLFGFAKMCSVSDLFLYDEDFIQNEISPNNIVKNIIPYVKTKLNKNKKAITDDNWQNALILCNNEHIYGIDTGFGFYESKNYTCHGYTFVETINSVLDLTVNLPAEQRILTAINFAIKQHKASLYPLVMVDTKTKDYKYFYKEEDKVEYFNSL